MSDHTDHCATITKFVEEIDRSLDRCFIERPETFVDEQCIDSNPCALIHDCIGEPEGQRK